MATPVRWVGLLAALAFVPSPAWAQAWLGDFALRRPITLGSAAALSDFQLSITLDTALLRPGCPDLRFTTGDGTTVVPHWVESGCGTANTVVWVRVPAIPASIFAYLVSPTAASTSNADAVHLFFDDFSQNPSSNGKWSNIYRDTGVSSAEFAWDAGALHLTEAVTDMGGGGTALTIAPAWEDAFEVAFRYRIFNFGHISDAGPGGDGLAMGFFHAGNFGTGGQFALARPGYAVEFDTFMNPVVDPTANHIAIVETVNDLSGDPPYVHLGRADTTLLRDLAWHAVRVQVLTASASVWVDGNLLVTANQVWNKTNRRLLFGAGTGNDFSTQAIDDVRVRRSAATAPSALVGAAEARPGSDGGTGPAPVDSVSASPNPTAGAVVLAWPASPAATRYELARLQGSTEQALGSTTNLRFADFAPGGRWQFVVRAANAAGTSAATMSAEVLVDDLPPLAPGTPALSEDARRAVYVVAWEPAQDQGGSGVELYEWQSSTDGTGWTTQSLTSATSTAFLSATGSYLFRVRARDVVGNWGPYSPASAAFEVDENYPRARRLSVGCQSIPATLGFCLLAGLAFRRRRRG